MRVYGLYANELATLSDDWLEWAFDPCSMRTEPELLTAVALAVRRRFAVRFERLHNDTNHCLLWPVLSVHWPRGAPAPAGCRLPRDHPPPL
jgi:hypothetical protein